jgi:O-antigen ligase
VPWLLRAAFAATAVLTFDVALLAVSRGAVIAMPVCALVFFAFVPGRLRHAVTLVPIAAACAAAVPAIIHLTDALGVYQPPPSLGAADAAGRAMVLGALAAFAVVAAGALLEARRPPSEATAARWRRIGHAGFGAAAVLGALAALVVVGNPVTRVDDAWSSFKGGYTESTGSRLSQGLGSNRYDFYRVALNVFVDHPIAGVGADNFFQQYLKDGRSSETPAYPHSIELRALAQTGIVGALMLFGAFAAALAAVWRAVRARPADDLRAAVAGGAGIPFIYWLVHGSADWFFEYPGLGVAAFAMLGLACSLAPRAGEEPAVAGAATPAGEGLRRPRVRVLAPVTALLALAAVALLGLWGADHEVAAAAKSYAKHPNAAYQRLDRARTLDPFSDRADSLAGSIAGRLGDLERADARFTRALDRVPDDQYATLERGAIASAAGRRAEAERLLARAARLAPRDATTREALKVVRSGGTLDLAAVNVRILSGAQIVAR